MTSPDLSAVLHDIADHIDAGDEFLNGAWTHVSEPTGLGVTALFGRRKAWVDGVLIARQVQAEQLRRIADWEWTDS